MAERILVYKVTVTGTEAQVKQLGRHEIAIKKLAGETRLLEKRALILAKKNREGGIVFRGLAKAIGENKDKTIDLRNAKNSLAKTISNESKLNRTNANTIGQVNAQLAIEKKRINDVVVGSKKFNIIARRIKDLERKQRDFNAQLGRGRTFVGEYSKGAVNAFAKIGVAIGATLIAFRTIQRLVGGTIKTIKEFDESVANLQKTANLTKDAARALAKEIIKIDTKTSVTNLLELASAAGRLGLEGDEIIEFTEQTDRAFVALGDSLDGTAEEIGLTLGKLAANFDLEKKFGIGEAINKVGSALNELGARSKAQEGPIIEFTKRLSGVANQAQISLPDIQALGALFDETGISIEVSATTFNKLLPAIGRDVQRFAKIAGVNVTEFRRIVEKDAFEALKLVAKGAQSNQEGLLGLTETLKSYGISNARAASVVGILSSKVDRLTELQKISNDAFDEGTSLSKEFEIKNNTLAATTEKLSKKWDAFVIGLDDGSGVIANSIRGVVEFATAMLEGAALLTQSIEQIDEAAGKSLAKETLKKLFEEASDGMEQSKLAADELIKRQANLVELNKQLKDEQDAINKLEEKRSIGANIAIKEIENRVRILRQLIERDKEVAIGLTEIIEKEKENIHLAELKKKSDKELEAFALSGDAVARKLFENRQDRRRKESDAEQELREKESAEFSKLQEEKIKALDKFIKRMQKISPEEKKIFEAEVESVIAFKEALEFDPLTLFGEEEDIVEDADFLIAEFQRTMDGKQQALEIQLANQEISQLEFNERKRELEEEQAEIDDAKTIMKNDLALGAAKNLASAIFTVTNNNRQRIFNEDLKSIRKQFDEESKLLQDKLNSGLISQQSFDDSIATISEQAAEREDKLRRETFNKQKKADLADAAAGIAIAIIRGLSKPAIPPFPSAIAAGIAGAIQLGVIAATKFAKGGVLKGRSHEEGGIAFTVDGQSGFEAEGGEILVNKNIHSRPDFVNAISQMNHITGGKRFQAGAILPIPNITRIQQQAVFQDIFTREEAVELIQEGITTITVQQVESEVTATQKTVETIESDTEF